jgi:hypothetical protein
VHVHYSDISRADGWVPLGLPRELVDAGSLKNDEGTRSSEWEQDISKKGRYALHNWLCPVAKLRAEGRDLLAVLVGANQRRGRLWPGEFH